MPKISPSQRRTKHLDDELTPAEAATLLGVSPRTLDRLKASRKIGHVKVGPPDAYRIYYSRKDIATYVNSLRRVS